MNDEELKTIRKTFPHNFIVFTVNPDNPHSEVQLKSSEWAVITKIDGDKTLQSLIDVIGLKEEEVLGLVFGLYKKALIQIKEILSPNKIYASEKFFEQLEATLATTIGPVANYLIDDVLWEMNEKRENFFKDKVPFLIESISQEINDEQKSVLFQQEMLEKIKRL